MPYRFNLPTHIDKDTKIVRITGFYQPDKDNSGYVHSFTYNRETGTVWSNIGNGDVSEEDAEQIKRMINNRIKK